MEIMATTEITSTVAFVKTSSIEMSTVLWTGVETSVTTVTVIFGTATTVSTVVSISLLFVLVITTLFGRMT